jgi:hypothetical protein
MEYTLEKLRKMYEEGKRIDEKLCAEQRTNVLLRAGEHYKKAQSSRTMIEQFRERGIISQDQSIRLTKNHIHRITNIFINATLDGNPSTQAVPFNEDEVQDVKKAEMNNSVMRWVKETNDWEELRDKFVSDQVIIGECWGKIRFDYGKGTKVVDEEGKESRLGEFVVDRVFGFDLKRDPNARSKEESRWWIHESMVDIEEFKLMVGKLAPDQLENVAASSQGTVKLFDANTGEYRERKDQVMVMELFVKPSIVNPNGWYVLFTDKMKITEDELPFGIYPLIGQVFDDLTTTPRGISIIKVCRPYQIEINRSASKMAEHQITVGDDKVYIQQGAKIVSHGKVDGVRVYKVSGAPPTVQPGRTGEQYMSYQLSQISEMYEACGLSDVKEDKEQLGDPYQLLYRSMREKKKFVPYITKYERFERSLFKTILAMAKKYLTDQHVIKIAGRTEVMNIEEFKTMSDDGYDFKLIPQSGDIESKFGKILSITQTLQYAGNQLGPDQIGELIKNLPMGNEGRTFSNLTVNADNAMNDILALDRGVYIPANPEDNHEYMINALTHRMKKPDFRFLNPEVQEGYVNRRSEHAMYMDEQKSAITQGNLGMIPSGGFLITVNASWYNPMTQRVERIKVPSASMQWLVQRLEQQGFYTQSIENLPPQVVAEMNAESNQVQQAPILQGLGQAQPEQVITGPQAQ